MAWFSVIHLSGATDTNGAAVNKASQSVNGLLYSVRVDKGTLANGADHTLAVVNSEFTKTILTLTDADTDDTEYFPRASSCGSTGTVSTDQNLMIPVVGVLQDTIAQGGSTKTGGLWVTVME